MAPRQHAQQVLLHSTRKARAAALDAVPEDIRDLVRAHVVIAFQRGPRPEKSAPQFVSRFRGKLKGGVQ